MSDDILDLDALAREQTGEPFTFRFGGETYDMPARLDIRAATALEAGRIEEGLRRLLGDPQWERLNQAAAVFDQEMLWAVLEGYAKHLGMDLGNSSASSGSSLPIRVRSRPTSSGTTESTLAS